MSATATDSERSIRTSEKAQARDRRPAFRVLEVTTIGIAFGLLATTLLSSHETISAELLDVVAWLPVVVTADLMPVTLWSPIQLTMSLPVLLAAGMVFSPSVALILGFLGNTDIRELRRDIPFPRALFNRSNIALSVFGASWLFHWAGGNVSDWPPALAFAALSLAVDMVINNSLTVVGAHLLFDRPIGTVVSDVYGNGRTTWFLFGYASFGAMAILLASVYLFAGNWGLIAFMIPVVLGHQMFSNSTALGVVARRLKHQQRAFASVSERIVDERRDERLTVAADLHDEVLPPLFKVHLMGQVIRQDIASGRLLELDDDVPGLLQAAEAANDAIRVLIRDLRRSSLGPHGLRHTLAMLTRQVQQEFGVVVETDLQEVTGHPLTHLLAYQVAREAMNNCIKHAPGSSIRLALFQDDHDFRLVVQDHGPGFIVESVDSDRHFGLQLMRERVELCGGVLVIDSSPGVGTTIAVRFPLERAT